MRLYSVRRFWTAGRGVTPGSEESYAGLSEAVTDAERISQRIAGAAVFEVSADRTLVSTRLVACYGLQADLIRRMVG